jgi:hypothetical protein
MGNLVGVFARMILGALEDPLGDRLETGSVSGRELVPSLP